MRFLTSTGHSRLFAFALLTVVALSGCGGSKTTLVVPDPSATTGLPAPSAAGPVNTYSGAQSPGAWTLTLDNTKNTFSYQPVTYPASATTGSIQATNGFTTLGTTGGYALEVEGRAAILRPGGVTTPIVFAVPQTECYSITGRVRFQYLAMSVGPSQPIRSTDGPGLEYGSIGASTDSTGKSWQFDDMQGTAVSGPVSIAGICSASNSQAAISFTGQQSILNDQWSNLTTTLPANTQSNVWVGPSGFFVADQSDPTAAPPNGASVAGVVEPATALNTTAVAAQTYSGFLYETATLGDPAYNSVAAPANTLPVSFGQVVASSGTTMIGGEFPNDDVTQTPNSDMMIDLGSQDATYNGLYLSVSITVLDPAQNCANYTGPGESATSGINAQGYATCTFSGMAIVGNPEGNYALFISAYNWAAQLGGAPMQIYLFQQ
jgi:hypothetical protein